MKPADIMRGYLKVAMMGIICVVASSTVFATSGSYSGPIDVRLGADGRTVTLLEPLVYTDTQGRRWMVPTGAIVDGASIPQWLWSVVGGPLEGKYREASVIHDYYCERRNRRAIDVHNVFLDAMLTSGVGPSRARIMHLMVLRFGPTWPDPKVDPACRTPDGSFDFGKCTENRVDVKSPVTLPPVTQDALDGALEEARQYSTEEDIELVRRAFQESKQ